MRRAQIRNGQGPRDVLDFIAFWQLVERLGGIDRLPGYRYGGDHAALRHAARDRWSCPRSLLKT